MGKRRQDADFRRFFDEFLCVKIPRLRATGVVKLDAPHAVIQFDEKQKLIGLAHTKFRQGGSWSYFRCPRCDRRCNRLWSVDDAPRCCKCCEAMNIHHRTQYGSRAERLIARDQQLDQLIAKLETREPLRFNGAPASWQGKAKLVYRSRRLTLRMRRSMIALRLDQLARQQANDSGGLNITRAYKPRAEALAAIAELRLVWRARSTERLQQALDTAQSALLRALESSDHRQRLIAARLMLRTRAARERGLA
jgi:hypothetical protein